MNAAVRAGVGSNLWKGSSSVDLSDNPVWTVFYDSPNFPPLASGLSPPFQKRSFGCVSLALLSC